MNKLFFFIFLIVLLSAPVLAIDIGYIVINSDTLTTSETSISNLLISENYSVDILDKDESINPDLYDLILVSNTVSDTRNIFDAKDHKTIFLSRLSAYKAGLSYSSGISTNSKVEIKNNQSIITKEFNLGSIQIYSRNVPDGINRLTGCLATNSKTLVSYNNYPVLMILPKRSLLIKNRLCGQRKIETNERIAFFGIFAGDSWNTNAEQLFKNTLTWVLYGEDADEDGFNYDIDCDDNNNQTWQNLPGYLDNDNDGYGTNPLLQVCSGDELLEGYSEINGDCNDSDVLINPDAQEIPYNSIDEDCQNGDLNDVDNDGFIVDCDFVEGICKVVGGDDCDDSDALINPSSSDVYKNCRNDAPVVQAVGKITVQETEIVTIQVIAEDPEDDNLEYSINSDKFTQQDNIFTWQTDYEDYGDYIFAITVSDGDLESKIEVEVQVTNLNQEPVCNEIPDLEWNEDEIAVLNLSQYCYDPDQEIIRYYFNSTSEDKHITLKSLNSETGIATFSVEENWNGEDWIIFKISDGKSEILTNPVVLRVLPVNDAPVQRNIPNITWNEDTNLINYLDLDDYFSDVDLDPLIYDVIGNHFITIEINQDTGLVSFYPDADWYGFENVVFSASDGSEIVYSNAIVLTVLDTNEPPEFQEMDCETEILEDTSYECELKASDFENDTLTFSLVSENNLDCEINGYELEYQGKLNYFGSASCTIRASDGFGYDEYILNVEIQNVNDAPVITNYNPKGTIKLMENTNQEFSISATDIDNSILNILWLLNDIEVKKEAGISSSYLFNQPKGTYILKVIVSDGEKGDLGILKENWMRKDCAEINSWCNNADINKDGKVDGSDLALLGGNWDRIYCSSLNNWCNNIDINKDGNVNGELSESYEWNIFVGDLSDFTCSEVHGFICSEKEICPANGEILGVYDTNSCCSVSCLEKPPEFSKAKTCSNLSQEIEINIKEPDEGEDFKIGDIIKVETKINNNAEEDLDFEVLIYLYDISEEEDIERTREKIDVDSGESEKLETEIEIPEDIDTDNKYAIFVRALGENNAEYCNQNYVKINIEREEHQILIKDLKIQPEKAVCGDYIDMNIEIENLGEKDENIFIVVENSELGINEKIPEFEIENYEDKNKAEKIIIFKIPENASAGEYKIKADVFFNDGDEKTTGFATLHLDECKKQETQVKETGEIFLEGEKREAKEIKINTQQTIFLLMSLFVSIIAIIFLWALIPKSQ